MFFFFKKPKLIVDAFVRDEYSFAVEYSPLKKASKFLPAWFKNLTAENEKSFINKHYEDYGKNVKGCPGIVDTLYNGFIIPLWCELRLDWNFEEYRYQFSDGISSITNHSNIQLFGFADDYWFLKIGSPWMLRMNRPINITFSTLTYHYPLDYPIKFLPGSYSSTSSENVFATNQFMVLKRSENKIIVPHNSPLIHMQIPLEYELKIRCHVDSNEHRRLDGLTRYVTFFRSFMKTRIMDRLRK